MHILILPSEEFVPEHSPMLGIFQADQAKILQSAGYQVGVISVKLRFSLPMILKGIVFKPLGRKTNNETDTYSFFGLIGLLYRKLFLASTFIKKEDYQGIPVYRVEGFYVMPPNQKHDHTRWVKAGKKAFKRYLKENGKPDLMHVHIALNAGLLAKDIKKKYGIPYWLTERISFFARNLYPTSLLPKAHGAYLNSDQVFTVSDFLGKGMQKIFPDFQYKVLPNTVDPVIEEMPLANKESSPFLIVSIGNLIPLKRHDLLINSFHLAFDESDDVKLEIIGDGEEEANLSALIASLNEENRIQLVGRLSKEEILKKLDAAHVLCHQSDYETFGVAVLEALFRGIPVITTRCGGPEETVTEQVGVCIEKNNEKELASALINMRKNIGNFDPVQIRNYAIENYGSKKFLSRMEGYINDLKL